MIKIYLTENENVYGKLNDYLSKLLTSPVKILRTENGKPYIEGNPLYFSISHSKDKALIAICDKRVGADIEVITDRNYGAVLARFSGEEKKEITSLTDFLKHWVIREAYIKMLGSTIAEKLKNLSCVGGVLYDNGKAVNCEFINESGKDFVYSICIDKQ